MRSDVSLNTGSIFCEDIRIVYTEQREIHGTIFFFLNTGIWTPPRNSGGIP